MTERDAVTKIRFVLHLVHQLGAQRTPYGPTRINYRELILLSIVQRMLLTWFMARYPSEFETRAPLQDVDTLRMRHTEAEGLNGLFSAIWNAPEEELVRLGHL